MSDPKQDELQAAIDAASKRPSYLVPLAILGGGALVFLIFYLATQNTSRGDKLPDWIKPPPPPRPMIQVEVLSYPPGAKVFLEDSGVSLAKTPGFISVSPGEHTLRFEVVGLALQRISINTEKDTQAEANWSAITVELNSNPEGAPLYLDGKAVATAPHTLYFPKDGKAHEIKAQHPPDPELVFSFEAKKSQAHLFNFLAPASTTSAPSSTSAPATPKP